MKCDKCKRLATVNLQRSFRRYDIGKHDDYVEDKNWDFWNWTICPNEPEDNLHLCAKHEEELFESGDLL